MPSLVVEPYLLRWSSYNPKLQSTGAISFGIPAYRASDGFVTCPMAGACAAVCYARQGKYVTMPNVRAAREFNLEFLRTRPMGEFVEASCHDLRRRRARIVRVHDSGDFFSQEYLDAWYEVARRNPEKAFYAYTKSLHLDLWSRRPGNFNVVQSEGGRQDERIDPARPSSRIFIDHASMRAAGFEDGTKSDLAAVDGTLRVGLVYHGRYRPTRAERSAFGWAEGPKPEPVEPAYELEDGVHWCRVPGCPKARVRYRSWNAIAVHFACTHGVNIWRRKDPAREPEPREAGGPVDVDLRPLFGPEDLEVMARAALAVEAARENLSGRLSEMEALKAKAAKLNRIIHGLEEILPRRADAPPAKRPWRRSPVKPGTKWGLLTVLEPVRKNAWSQILWLAECACGRRRTAWGYNLVKGITRSCGCRRKEEASRA